MLNSNGSSVSPKIIRYESMREVKTAIESIALLYDLRGFTDEETDVLVGFHMKAVRQIAKSELQLFLHELPKNQLAIALARVLQYGERQGEPTKQELRNIQLKLLES